MSTKITLQNLHTGLTETGYCGSSSTAPFFGLFPASLRGDFATFLIVFAATIILYALREITFGIGHYQDNRINGNGTDIVAAMLNNSRALK